MGVCSTRESQVRVMSGCLFSSSIFPHTLHRDCESIPSGIWFPAPCMPGLTHHDRSTSPIHYYRIRYRWRTKIATAGGLQCAGDHHAGGNLLPPADCKPPGVIPNTAGVLPHPPGVILPPAVCNPPAIIILPLAVYQPAGGKYLSVVAPDSNRRR